MGKSSKTLSLRITSDMEISKNKSAIYTWILVSGAIILLILSRLILHIPNFAPVSAMALFAGTMLTRNLRNLLMMLGVIVLSDLAIELSHPGQGFYSAQPFVYASYAIIYGIGAYGLKSRLNIIGGIAGTLASTLIFFVVSNFGVWAVAGQANEMYPHTLGGLIACYTAAIPFLRPTFLSDMFFSGVFFGAFALISQAQLRTEKAGI